MSCKVIVHVCLHEIAFMALFVQCGCVRICLCMLTHVYIVYSRGRLGAMSREQTKRRGLEGDVSLKD